MQVSVNPKQFHPHPVTPFLIGKASTMATTKKSSGSRNAAAAQKNDKDRPVHVVKIRNIRGNIWANRLPSGQVMYNVTIDRLWKR